jgi:hypothetical protein
MNHAGKANRDSIKSAKTVGDFGNEENDDLWRGGLRGGKPNAFSDGLTGRVEKNAFDPRPANINGEGDG